MNAQVVKLTINIDEDVMLIAPNEIMRNFLWKLKSIIYNAANGEITKNNIRTVENYYELIEQINDILKEIKEE